MGPGGGAVKGGAGAVKVGVPKREFDTDKLMAMAAENWAGEGKAFNAAIVKQVYDEQLKPSNFALSRIMCLEYSQYLEKYLWPNFDAAEASDAHILSLVLMVNEKFREQVMSWEPFEKRADVFPTLFSSVLALHEKASTSHRERSMIVLFLIHAFQSLENAMVRGVALAQVSLPLWQHLSLARLELEIKQAPHLEKKWKTMLKKQKKEGVDKSKDLFLPRLIDSLYARLAEVPKQGQGKLDIDLRRYLERVLELLIDLVVRPKP
jgi:intron-binding protein aquarius